MSGVAKSKNLKQEKIQYLQARENSISLNKRKFTIFNRRKISVIKTY